VYPGGPIIEKLAKKGDSKYHEFTRPMKGTENLDFSYSGIKTALYYFLKDMDGNDIKKNRYNIAASFQEAVFESLIWKLSKAIDETNVKNVLVGGGVVANSELRKKIKNLVGKKGGAVLFPSMKSLYGDNAGMIGVVFAAKTTFINPASFTLWESVMILCIVVIGGIIVVLVLLGTFGMGLLIRPLTGRMVALECEIRAKTAVLESELDERKRAEERIEHLNLVLRAIRGLRLVEMERNGKGAWCCGSGAWSSTAYSPRIMSIATLHSSG